MNSFEEWNRLTSHHPRVNISLAISQELLVQGFTMLDFLTDLNPTGAASVAKKLTHVLLLNGLTIRLLKHHGGKSFMSKLPRKLVQFLNINWTILVVQRNYSFNPYFEGKTSFELRNAFFLHLALICRQELHPILPNFAKVSRNCEKLNSLWSTMDFCFDSRLGLVVLLKLYSASLIRL